MRKRNDSGQRLRQRLAIASIYLTGYQNDNGTSAVNGTFTFPNVYANKD
jgi:hypothetical protein